MSRHAMIEDRNWVIKRLNEVNRGRKPAASYHLRRVLENNGLLKSHLEKTHPGPGRSERLYVLTKKAQRLIEKAKAEREEARAKREHARQEKEDRKTSRH